MNTIQTVPVYRMFFSVGFVAFSLLYCAQALLPELSRSFAIDPATSALGLSASTGGAISFVVFGALSSRLPRRKVVLLSLTLGALLNAATALASSWRLFIALRGLEGLVLGGVLTMTMALIAEESEPHELSYTMGRYVSGTAFGAMMGRVGMGALIALFTWRAAMIALGLLDLAIALCDVGALNF